MPRTPKKRLPWNAPYVAKVMARNKIAHRGALADRLDEVGRATIYRVFNEDWSGEATPVMIDVLRRHFNASVGRLIAHPAINDISLKNKTSRQVVADEVNGR